MKRIRLAKQRANKPESPPHAPSLSAIPGHVSSPKSSQQSTTTGDDSDGLVTRRRGVAKNRNPVYRMSGAVPIEDVIQDGERLKPIRGQERKELNRLAREDVAAKKAIDSMRQRMEAEKAEREALRQQQPHRAQSTSRPTGTRQPATLQVQRSQPDSETYDEGVRLAPGSAWKRGSAAPMSVRKPYTTPRAEASMLALAHFKQRKRAPSILGIGNADETASISSEGSFGDIVPDDESTPLPTRRPARGRASLSGVSPPSLGDVEPRTSSSRKRKRGSNEFRVPDSQPEKSILTPEPSRQQPIEVPSNHSSSSESDVDLPELPEEHGKQSSHTPSSTMAPPESSSPTKPMSPGTPAHDSSPLRSRAAKKTKGGQGIAKDWKQAGKKPAKTVNTAALQNMLPKRRQKAADGDFDIWDAENSAGGTDDDELSFAPSKRQATGRRGRQALSDKKSAAKNAKTTGKNARAASKMATPLVKSSRTYSRRQSENENEITISDDDNSSASSDAAVGTTEAESGAKRANRVPASKKLQAMAQKFAEVDRWDMDFEEATGSSDTFKNAR